MTTLFYRTVTIAIAYTRDGHSSRIFIDLTQTQPEMTPDLTPLEEKDLWIF